MILLQATVFRGMGSASRVGLNPIVQLGDALPELYCFVSTIRPLNVAS
jgi:hypothetical protein